MNLKRKRYVTVCDGKPLGRRYTKRRAFRISKKMRELSPSITWTVGKV